MARLANGEIQEAEQQFRAILSGDARHAEALHGLACVARARQDYGRAIGFAGKALAQEALSDSQRAVFHLTLGLALDEAGHEEAARAALHVSLLLEPRDPRAYVASARVFRRLGRLDDAIIAYRKAVDYAADDTAYRHELAALLLAEGHVAEAITQFEILADRNAGDAVSQANLGAALFEAGQVRAARERLRLSALLATPTAETANNLGLADMAMGDFIAASRSFDDARIAAPTDRRIMGNQATLLLELGEVDRAAVLFQSVIDEHDDLESARAQFNLGTLHLARGQMREGWARFEMRHRLLGTPGIHPAWNGQKTQSPVSILVEQGLGDLVQFMRYLPEAAARAPLYLEFPETVWGLVEMMPAMRSLLGDRVHLRRRSTSKSSALKCQLLSLPFLLGCDGPPNAAPYMVSEVPVVAGRIGIAWAGNPGYRFDARRSISRALLAPILRVPNIEFVCLQREATPAESAGMHVVDLSDLAATARAIASCDLIVTVDSVVAHLAGALGRPTWLMNRFGGDWRWRGPAWYHDMREFQVPSLAPPEEAWPPLIDRVALALREWSGRRFSA